MEFLTSEEKPEMEVPRECSECGGNLWRNGYSSRIACSLNVCARFLVPRVVCAECRRSSTCLYDFLLPYKRYEESVHSEYVKRYMTTDESYREVAWGDMDGDNVDAAASLSRVFRAVAEACTSAEMFLQHVQQELVQLRIAVPELDAEWVKPVQTGKKLEQLFFLFYAIVLAMTFCGGYTHRWSLLRRHISVRRSSGYSLRYLDFRLSAPQTLQHPLL